MKTIALLTTPYYFIDARSTEFLPPMQLLYLASYIERHGVSVDIFDISQKFGIQKDLDEIESFKKQFRGWAEFEIIGYDVIGLSCYTSFQYQATVDIAVIIKKLFPLKEVVVGGYHPTAIPKDFIFRDTLFDFVVVGEGEDALLQIVNDSNTTIKETKIVSDENVQNIGDISRLNLNLLSDWSEYYHFYEYLSRGCPYQCKFCMESVKPVRKWRALTPDDAISNVDKNIQFIAGTSLRNKNMYMFSDANFGYSKTWLLEFLNLLCKRNYSVTFFASPRIENLDEEVLTLMKKCNFSIDLPIEHGSVKMLKMMNKCITPSKYLSLAREVSKMAVNLELPHHTHWVYGYPGETFSTLLESLSYMKEIHEENNFGMTEIFLFKMYPGAWIYENWEEAEKVGAKKLLKEFWRTQENVDDVEYSIQPSSNLSRGELLEFVGSTVKPYGRTVNRKVISNHKNCCGHLKRKNAPWIL